MRIAYPSGTYRKDSTTGGNMHIGQFISNVVAMGHEVWTWPGSNHPAAHRMPPNRLQRIKTLRQMDVVYMRFEWAPPKECRWSTAPYRQLIGSPVIVWEFNTVPEQGLTLGRSETEINKAIKEFRHYGYSCDLAICVSKTLTDYVRDKLGIKRVVTIPNGSDPDLFHPDVTPVKRMRTNYDQYNVVWIGSAYLAWHDFELLQATAQLLWQSNHKHQIIFHIIGQANSGLMRDMPPNVFYWGSEDYVELPHWLAAMDVGLCNYYPGPGDFSSPLKIFDYMASGLAVVGTFHPQLQEVLNEMGQTDMLVPPKDSEALANLLMDLASDHNRTRILGQAGRQRVIDFYNWRRAAEDTIHEIEIILEERR